MKDLIHIGNFKEDQSKVLRGTNAKVFVGGIEVASFRPEDFIGLPEQSETETIAKETIARDAMTKECSRKLEEEINQRLCSDVAGFKTPIFEPIDVVHVDGAITEEDIEEAALKVVANFGKPDYIYLSDSDCCDLFGIEHKPLEIDLDSIKTEIKGNELHVDINMVLERSIDFIPLNIEISNIKVTSHDDLDKFCGVDEIKAPLLHIGNFKDVLQDSTLVSDFKTGNCVTFKESGVFCSGNEEISPDLEEMRSRILKE